jgi:hypothetical protein
MTSLIGYNPSKEKLRPGNYISTIRHAPFLQAAMETAPAKQETAIERCSEKRLPASRAFPVCQPGGDKKVRHKG